MASRWTRRHCPIPGTWQFWYACLDAASVRRVETHEEWIRRIDRARG